MLSVMDAYTRECLALEVDTSFASRRVTRVLEAIVAERGLPQAIRCDNGPELTSRHFLAWCMERKIELVHIEPGKPMQNAHVESFHGKLRDECLNVSWFENLFDARRKIAAWREEYNEERPHSAWATRRQQRSRGNSLLRLAPRFALRQTKQPSHKMRMSYDPPCESGGRSSYGAIEDFSKALEHEKPKVSPLAPDSDMTYENRADAYMKVNDYDAATADYDRVIGSKL